MPTSAWTNSYFRRYLLLWVFDHAILSTMNDFSKLDAQSEESRFAQFTPEEHAEYQAYLDAHEADLAVADDPRDDAPDAHLDAAYEERTELEEPPYDGGGFPGDGSGTDDLADLMAHGDEGCCDGPGD